jgi:hypothetical protein
MATSNIAPSFPADLDALPASACIRQAFGWTAGTWAFGLFVFSSLVFTQPAKPMRNEYIATAVGFVLGLMLLVYEVRRRRNPRVLARFPQYNQIGVYKRGKLNRTVNVEDVNLVLYHPSRTWGPLMVTVMGAIFFAVFVVPGFASLSLTNHIYFALGSLLFASFALSLIKTRLRCETCMVPYEKRRGSEWILVPRKAIPLLLSRVPNQDLSRVSS